MLSSPSLNPSLCCADSSQASSIPTNAPCRNFVAIKYDTILLYNFRAASHQQFLVVPFDAYRVFSPAMTTGLSVDPKLS